MMVTKLPTVQRRYGVGATYRLLLGRSEGSPSVEVKVGYSKSKFKIDKSKIPTGVNLDVPNTIYTWIDPGLRFRMPLGQAAALHAEGRFLAVMGTGEMQKPTQYGAAKVTGFDAEVGMEYWLTSRYLVRAGGRYTALGYDYQGNGVLTDRDGDGAVDVGGALDAYLAGYIAVGAAF